MNLSSDNSDGEGFYKPAIQVTTPSEILQPSIHFSDEEMDEPINIITEDRPLDYKPRCLYSFQYNHYQSGKKHECGETMMAIPYNKIDGEKDKRYSSLQAKYKGNPQYKLIYSKKADQSQFSSYYFSLENTTDYNPSDYFHKNEDQCPQQNIFDSRFQCGNLLYAFEKINSPLPQYDLIMQNDTNTKGYSQWFYFLCRNKETKRIKINIVNFIKKRLMFLDGVRPVGFSIKQYQSDNIGWQFMGQNVEYKKSYITREICGKNGNPSTFHNYYTLSFQVDFSHFNDTMYLALNYPYTYTRMNNFVDAIVDNPPKDVTITKNILCHSISNNAVPYLKIRHKDNYSRNIIVCIGRQHPGETVGSFVLEGFVNELLKNASMLKKYQFYVIPMINPDGVIYGNFRTNLSGFDLNRQWVQPNRWLHPEIYFLSKLISALPTVDFCIDFHGHSKKLNSFIYACTSENVQDFRIFPYIYSKCCDLFSLSDCTFNITPDKMKTARVRVFKEIKKPYVYTLETSFFGHTKNAKNTRFKLRDFDQIGKGAAQAMALMLLDKKTFAKYEEEVKNKNFMFEQWAMNSREDNGSESNPSEDQLNPLQRKKKVMSDIKALRPPKKMKKTKKHSKNEKKKKQRQRQRQKEKEKEKDQFRFVLKQKAESAALFEKNKEKLKPKKLQESDFGVVIIKQKKKIKEIPSTPIEPKIKPSLPPPPKKNEQIKTMGPNVNVKKKEKTQNSSNLFDTAKFFNLRQQSFKKKQEKLQILNSKQIVNDTMFDKKLDSCNNSRRSSIRKLQVDEPSSNALYRPPKKKNREKIYIIKENKVINSITRVNEEDVKRQIQKQISSKTMVLRNCQKIMSTMGIQPRNQSMETRHQRRNQSEVDEKYKTKKMLKPLDIRRHRNFGLNQQREGIFFSFI